jgi:hypothetical protein
LEGAIFQIAPPGTTVDVEFIWEDKTKAAFPNSIGRSPGARSVFLRSRPFRATRREERKVPDDSRRIIAMASSRNWKAVSVNKHMAWTAGYPKRGVQSK